MKKNMRAKTPAEIPRLAAREQEQGQLDVSPLLRPFLSRLTQNHFHQRLPELLVSPEVRHTHDGVEPSKGLNSVLKEQKNEKEAISSMSLRAREGGRKEADLSETQRALDDVLSFNFDLVGGRVDGVGHFWLLKGCWG